MGGTAATYPELANYTKRRRYAADATHKTCTRCGAEKPLEAFSSLKGGALGRSSKCRECLNAMGKDYTRANREGKATRPRPDACEACHQPNTARRALHWDHDHATGAFRGWLCHGCNTAMGNLDDSIERLELLIQYLMRHR